MDWTSEYRPYPQQQRFHCAHHKFKWFLAGLGAGKSLAGLHEFVKLVHINCQSDSMIVSPTYPMLRDVIMPLFSDWLDPYMYTWKKASNIIQWHTTGRQTFLRTCTHPDHIRGPNISHFWFDEPAIVISRKSWEISASRLRCARAKVFRGIATTTPRGFNWLAKVFSGGSADEYVVVRSKTRDNPYLPPDFEPGLRALYGDEFARQELDAIILELAGQVWPCNRRVHVRDSFGYVVDNLTYFGGIDSGFTNPSAIVVGGIDSDGRWYIVDGWYMRGQDRLQVAQQVALMQKKWRVKKWWSDHDPELISQIQRQGCAVEKAEKDVLSGVQHVRTLFPVRADGLPMIFISSTLKDWHRECEGYQFPPQQDGEPTCEENPIGLHGDHYMDATRYMIYSHAINKKSSDYQGLKRNAYSALQKPGKWDGL